jgi:hypothetical protein
LGFAIAKTRPASSADAIDRFDGDVGFFQPSAPGSVNQTVRAPSEVHDVLAKLRISGNDHRVTRRIDAISKGRFHSSVIDEECGDSRQTIIVYFPLRDFFRIDFDAFGWKVVGGSLTNADIKSKSLKKMFRHAASSLRNPRF